MKVLFDTNVIIAAFVSHGACEELFEHCITSHTICVPRFVLEEFIEKLSGKLKFPKKTVDTVVSYIKANTTPVDSSALSSPVCRDPQDDAVLAAAVQGNVDCIVTGDEDLLVLKQFQKIPILKPVEFWKFEKGGSRTPLKQDL